MDNAPPMELKTAAQQEMVEDLMAIVHTFSCRLYGMRKYKQQIQADFVEYKIGKVSDDLQ